MSMGSGGDTFGVSDVVEGTRERCAARDQAAPLENGGSNEQKLPAMVAIGQESP